MFAVWIGPIVLTRYSGTGITTIRHLQLMNDVRTTLLGALAGAGALGIAQLAGADLRHASLFSTKLVGAYLNGTDLRAKLESANLHGAMADGLTQWPAGFDVLGAGVRQSPDQA